MPGPGLLQQPIPSVWEWTVFSPGHRVELTAHAIPGPEGWVVFDPIEAPDGWMEARVAAVILTNANHARAAAEWRRRFGCPVWAPIGAGVGVGEPRWYSPGESPVPGWISVPLTGGASGETAFRIPELDLVVFGDAVVHLPGRPLELLPDKYCTDATVMRTALRRLVAEPFARALFAHGYPLTEKASARVGALM